MFPLLKVLPELETKDGARTCPNPIKGKQSNISSIFFLILVY